MLTESELRWAEETRHLCKRCEWNLWDNPCIRYGRLGMEGSCPGFSPRNLQHDFRDAAEFEARVARYIVVENSFSCCPPDAPENCEEPFDTERCATCWLKYARLAIEEEMERKNEK